MLGTILQNLELEDRIPIIHKYIYNKLLNKDCKPLRNIPIDELKISKDIVRKFLYRYMVPLEIQDKFLAEMQAYGLIKIINNKEIEIIK